MGLKEQFKNNWLIIILVLIMFFIFLGGTFLSSFSSQISSKSMEMADYGYNYQESPSYASPKSDFALR